MIHWIRKVNEESFFFFYRSVTDVVVDTIANIEIETPLCYLQTSNNFFPPKELKTYLKEINIKLQQYNGADIIARIYPIA